MMKRGDIHYISDRETIGSEQRSGRPAIIVSNDTCNLHSPVVEIVYLTTKPKNDMPTHVTIRSTPVTSTALCEQISSVSIDRIGDFMAKCTDLEMDMIDSALCISLAIEQEPIIKSAVKQSPIPSKVEEELRKQLNDTQNELAIYKNMYNQLINSVLTRRD